MNWTQLIFVGLAAFLMTAEAKASDVTVTNSAVQPATANACPGSTVNALAIKLTNNTSTAISINSWQFTLNGTGSETDFTLNMYSDNNCNGTIDSNDLLVGQNPCGIEDWEACNISSCVTILGNQSICLILTLTFNSTSPIGKTYQVRVAPPLWNNAGGTNSYTDNSTSTTFTLTNCSGSNTSTSTSTSTTTSTATQTNTNTSLASTATYTNTQTATNTSSQTITSTALGSTATSTATATNTNTNSVTSTLTQTETNTPLGSTATCTDTNTLSSTPSPTNTNTPQGPTSTSTSTPTITQTPTQTLSPTNTFSPTATALNQVIVAPPYPNPSNGGPIQFNITTPGAANIEMEIYTIAMRKIVDHNFVAGGGGPQGTLTNFTWDLHDRMSRLVSNGLYYVRIRVTGSSASDKIFKILVLR